MAGLVDSNKHIDFITLKQAPERSVLNSDEIGGPEYLSDLFSFVPNADYYIAIIREKLPRGAQISEFSANWRIAFGANWCVRLNPIWQSLT